MAISVSLQFNGGFLPDVILPIYATTYDKKKGNEKINKFMYNYIYILCQVYIIPESIGRMQRCAGNP